MEAVEVSRVSPCSENNSSQVKWPICGQTFPKTEIVFFVQVLIIYIVIITCIINLSLSNNEDCNCCGKFWIALLSSCLGYLLPNPSMKKKLNQ